MELSRNVLQNKYFFCLVQYIVVLILPALISCLSFNTVSIGIFLFKDCNKIEERLNCGDTFLDTLFTFMQLWPGSRRREWPGSGAMRALDKKIKSKIDKSK